MAGIKINLKDAVVIRDKSNYILEAKGKDNSGTSFYWQSPTVFTVDTSLGTSVELDSVNKDSGTTCTVDWGDGTIETATQGLVHTYTSPSSVYDVKVTGDGPFWLTIRSYDNVIAGKGYYGNGTDRVTRLGSTNLASMVNLPSTLTDFSLLFFGKPINQSFIVGLDTSNAINTSFMFSQNTDFNQDISGWDVSSVVDMNNMFFNALSFNRDLSSWDISSVTDMTEMFNGSAMSTENYSRTLIGWANSHFAGNAQDNVTLGASGITYNNTAYTTGNEFNDAASARAYLVDTAGWTITDGGQV